MTIYVIHNIVNNKCYIGQTIDYKTRNKQHKSDLKCNRHYNNHLQYSWNKYGEDNFEFKILEDGFDTIDELNDAEEFWINMFKTCNKKYGYNKRFGGNQTRLTKVQINEMKETRTKRDGKKVFQYDLNGNLLNIFPSIREAGRQTNTFRTSISSCCHKKDKHITSNGYYWSFKKEENPEINPNTYNKKSIVGYSHQEKKLYEFESLIDGANFVNRSASSVHNSCTEKTNTSGRFIWFFKEDFNEKDLKRRIEKEDKRFNKRTLTKEKVRKIKKLLKNTNLTHKEIGDKFDVSRGTISYIKNNKTKKWVDIH